MTSYTAEKCALNAPFSIEFTSTLSRRDEEIVSICSDNKIIKLTLIIYLKRFIACEHITVVLVGFVMYV